MGDEYVRRNGRGIVRYYPGVDEVGNEIRHVCILFVCAFFPFLALGSPPRETVVREGASDVPRCTRSPIIEVASGT